MSKAPKYNKAFEKRKKYLDSLNIEYGLETEFRGDYGKDRREYNLNLFRTVKLPFTPEQWCSIAMSDGESYVGGCCGTMSALQDKIDYCFRYGSGWISIQDLYEIFELFKSHGEYDYFIALRKKGSMGPKVEECRSQWSTLSVWEKMALIWFLVKDYYLPQLPGIDRKDRPEIYNAIARLNDSFYKLSIVHAFQGDLFVSKTRDMPHQQHADYVTQLSKVLPDLKTVVDQIKNLDLGTFEGIAVVSKENHKHVASNGFGLCIYKDQKEVDSLFKNWDHNEEERETRSTYYKGKDSARDLFTTVPVRVSFENGIEFLEGNIIKAG